MNRPKLDLHGRTYDESKSLVEDFVLNEQYNLPIEIITGNSDKMKKVVINVLEYYGFSFDDGDFFNAGYIKVTK